MEDTCAYMTETVFIKSYRYANRSPIRAGEYEEMRATGDAELHCFMEQMPERFAENATLRAFLQEVNHLAQTQHGSLRVYLNEETQSAAAHITSNIYVMIGEVLPLFRAVAAHADGIIVRMRDGENGAIDLSLTKDLA